MTGVLRPYRGKGVATLLKLRGIRYTQEHGKHKLWVVNDSVNQVEPHCSVRFLSIAARTTFSGRHQTEKGQYISHRSHRQPLKKEAQ